MDEKSQECRSQYKSAQYLLMFFLFVIIILLSGIFYTLQGMSSMCSMKSGYCPMQASSGALCPIYKKAHTPQGK